MAGINKDSFQTIKENYYPSFEGEKYLTLAEPADSFLLESGISLGPVTVNYQTYGKLSSRGDNAIYIAHALTGGSLAGEPPCQGKERGWWESLIGPGKAFDTERYFIVCSNVLGGCYGTTGPSALDTRTGRPYAMKFPVVTIKDMVRVQKILLDHLGVKELVSVAGGSMGGMQALQWAVTYPHMVRSVIAVASTGRFSPIGIAFNQAERQAIMIDPSWCRGQYYGTDFPRKGLSLARIIGTITYRSNESFEQRFGRSLQIAGERNLFAFDEQFAVESYLNHQGEKVTYRFDPNSYLYLSKAMDLHDLGRGYISFQAALKRIRCIVFLMGISTDILFYPQEVRGLAVEMRRCGVEARYQELKSPHGHDSFLIEFKEMEAYIRECLSSLE
ncbi:MAG: homoserine O-acetyltransferase [Dethiobacter sp.]|jgi:homoserine O-acetyltransferase|nr:MAG: homoserine O-acetyltransferase [Dethiobacter sp.]